MGFTATLDWALLPSSLATDRPNTKTLRLWKPELKRLLTERMHTGPEIDAKTALF
jgi:hypothetical protein